MISLCLEKIIVKKNLTTQFETVQLLQKIFFIMILYVSLSCYIRIGSART